MKKVKKEEQERTTEINNTHSTAEIPRLVLNLQQACGDMITVNVSLESRSWDMKEAKDGMNYLIKEFNKMLEKIMPRIK